MSQTNWIERIVKQAGRYSLVRVSHRVATSKRYWFIDETRTKMPWQEKATVFRNCGSYVYRDVLADFQCRVNLQAACAL